MRLIYSFLIYKGIQARQLFGDEESKRISETAGRSVSDMIIWVEHAVNKALNQADTVQETDTVVDAVKRYIAQNIDQDLSREAVAEQVYLHPDHLTRIFKKKWVVRLLIMSFWKESSWRRNCSVRLIFRSVQ